jgi:hypothetical protein
MAVDIEKLKKDWVGIEFDTAEFEVKEHEVLDYAAACGEAESRYTDPSDPDFQAPPNFTARFSGRRIMPEAFPRIGRGFGFDAGKGVQIHGPVRPGDKLTGTSLLHDIYSKTGRSGTMVFIVHRMVFRNERGEKVSTVDWRMVQPLGKEES